MQSQQISPNTVSVHNNETSCWVIFKGKVYDVSQFIHIHPGGHQLILDNAGKDISTIFEDSSSYKHSESALEILQDFYIGDIGPKEGNENNTLPSGNTPKIPSRNHETFLDLKKPLLEQMFFNSFSKEFYLSEVHKPRCTTGSPLFMSSPFLEIFTRTSWYVVPLYWTPISVWFAYMCLQKLSLSSFAMCCLSGIFIFSFIEYVLHRFLFHLDDLLPDKPFALFVHFLFHGVHHYIPMDKKRLVLPPALATAIGLPLIKLAYLIIPNREVCNGLISGAIIGYMCYDLMHYYIHHGKMFNSYFQEMKTYHMAHHYSNYASGFGITSKLWDYCFGTVLELPTVTEPKDS